MWLVKHPTLLLCALALPPYAVGPAEGPTRIQTGCSFRTSFQIVGQKLIGVAHTYCNRHPFNTINQERLLCVRDIRAKYTNTFCTEQSDISENTAYSEKANCFGSGQYRLFLVYPFDVVNVFKGDSYCSQQSPYTNSFIVRNNIQWKDEETRES